MEVVFGGFSGRRETGLTRLRVCLTSREMSSAISHFSLAAYDFPPWAWATAGAVLFATAVAALFLFRHRPNPSLIRDFTFIILLALPLLAAQFFLSAIPQDWTWKVPAGKTLRIAGILLLSYGVGRILITGVRIWARSSAAIRTARGTLEFVVRVASFALGGLVLLEALEISITPFLATLGIGSLAVALALQDTLANFFAGLYLAADRPIRAGDFVRLDSGDEGYVESVGWRSTRLRTLPNNTVVIPNERLAKSIITNYDLPEPRMSLLIGVSTGYDADSRKVEQILVEIATTAARDVPGLLPDPAPFVRFIPGFGESALEFTLICQVRQFVDQYAVQHELRHRILERFRREGIEIPFPQRVVTLKRENEAPLQELAPAERDPVPPSGSLPGRSTGR